MPTQQNNDWLDMTDPKDREKLSGKDHDWSDFRHGHPILKRPDVKLTKLKHPVINVHAHLINFLFIPDSFNFKYLLEGLRRVEVTLDEAMVRFFKWPITAIGSAIGYKWVDEFIGLMDISDISQTARIYAGQMDKAKLDCSAAFMMDLEYAYPKETGKVIPTVPFENQVLYIWGAVNQQKVKDRFMPFIMFDPRRELDPNWKTKFPNFPMDDFVDFCRYAVEVLQFTGIKMYPQLGYHPSEDDKTTNTASVRRRLKKLYKWCDQEEARGNAVPIVTHCSQGGAWVIDPKIQKKVGSPSAWAPVLEKHPNLTINFAHFGGDWYDDTDKENTRRRWREQIRGFISNYRNVYTDVSCNETALNKDKEKPNQAAYFTELKNDLTNKKLRNKILFGTDWPMMYHSWTDKEFTRAFRQNLTAPQFKQIACDNPRRFLGDRLPPRWRNC